MQDHQIRTLLDLHDQIIDQEGGYWLKIEAWEVISSEVIPHGIRYSLTLHDPNGKRILGYDNAHAVKLRVKNIQVSDYRLIISIEMLATRAFLMNSRMRISCCQIFLAKSMRF